MTQLTLLSLLTTLPTYLTTKIAWITYVAQFTYATLLLSKLNYDVVSLRCSNYLRYCSVLEVLPS